MLLPIFLNHCILPQDLIEHVDDQKRQQNYQEETTNSKNPLRDGNPPQRERISADNLTAIGKSFDLKNKQMTQKIRKTFGLFKDTAFLSLYWTDSSTYVREKNHSLFHKIYIVERNSFEKKSSMRRDNRKKTSGAKRNSFCIYVAGENGILCSITIWFTNSFRWKDP